MTPEETLNWLNKEIKKDKISLEYDKQKFIHLIKNYKKEDLVAKKPNKISFLDKLKLLIWGS